MRVGFKVKDRANIRRCYWIPRKPEAAWRCVGRGVKVRRPSRQGATWQIETLKVARL